MVKQKFSEEEKKIRWKAYLKEYSQRSEVKARRKLLRQRPWVMAYRKAYQQRPKVKAKAKAKIYHNKSENIARQKEYSLLPEVKAHRKSYHKKYIQRADIKARIKASQKLYQENPEVKAKAKIYDKEYNLLPEVKVRKKVYRQIPETKDKKNLRERERRRTDTQFRIRSNLRTRFCSALNHFTKTGKIKTSKQYGINYQAIIQHLQPFPSNIHLYHIDHIRPLCSFNLEDLEQIKQAFAPGNHQWLLAFDNMSKGGKWIIDKSLSQ